MMNSMQEIFCPRYTVSNSKTYNLINVSRLLFFKPKLDIINDLEIKQGNISILPIVFTRQVR